MTGKEIAIVGVMINGTILSGTPTLATMHKYDGTTLIVTNYRVHAMLIYERT